MAKESVSIPIPHGTNQPRKAGEAFPGGIKTLVLMLITVLILLVPSSYYRVQVSFGSSPMETHTSDLTAITGGDDIACDLFNGSWVKDFRGPVYTNWTCPTLPDSRNCRKYGKPVDFENWRWKPHGCEIPRFEPQLFLNIVRGKTLAFAGDSVGRNQMESLLCMLSQVEAPINIYCDTKDKFATWYFKSHNFTLMVLWTKFLVQGFEREINGTVVEVHDIHLDKLDTRLAAILPHVNILVISSSHWLFRENYLYEGGKLIGCIYCSQDNITNVSIPTAIQKVFRTALENLKHCQECKLQLTVVRTATPTHFENGTWNTGGSCKKTRPMSEGEEMADEIDWVIRKTQIEEAKRAQRENKMSMMNIEVLDVTKAMAMRPDAHPGVNWPKQWARGYSDCVHFCLPGPIDMWNELFLAVLDKYKKILVDQ